MLPNSTLSLQNPQFFSPLLPPLIISDMLPELILLLRFKNLNRFWNWVLTRFEIGEGLWGLPGRNWFVGQGLGGRSLILMCFNVPTRFCFNLFFLVSVFLALCIFFLYVCDFVKILVEQKLGSTTPYTLTPEIFECNHMCRCNVNVRHLFCSSMKH